MQGVWPVRSAVGVSLILVSLWCVVFRIVFTPAYETGDEVTMALVAAGLHGTPGSECVIFSNVLLGAVLRALYGYRASVDWYGLLLYATLALSIVGLFLAILWRGISLRSTLCCLGVTSLALPYWMSLQFTTVAVWAAWGGAWLFVASRGAPTVAARVLRTLGGALLVLGCLIRVHAAIMALVIILPWLVDAVRPAPPRRMVVALLVVLGICAGVTAGDSLYYRSRPEWRAWLAYNAARAQLHDRYFQHAIDPRVMPKVEAAGWSELDVELFRSGVFFDPHLYDLEHLREVAEALAGSSQPPAGVWLGLRWRLSLVFLPQIAPPLLLYLCFGARRRAYVARAAISFALLLALGFWLASTYKLEDRHLLLLIDTVPLATTMWLAEPVIVSRRGDRWLRAIGVVVFAAYAYGAGKGVWGQHIESRRNARYMENAKRVFRRFGEIAMREGRDGRPALFLSLGRGTRFARWNPFEGVELLRDVPVLRFGWLTHSPHYRATLDRWNLHDLYTDMADGRQLLVVCDRRVIRLLVQFLRERRNRAVVADAIPVAGLQNVFGAQVYRLRAVPEPAPHSKARTASTTTL